MVGRGAQSGLRRPDGRDHLPSDVGIAAEGEAGTAALAGMSKVVFSTTLREPLAWANTQLVT